MERFFFFVSMEDQHGRERDGTLISHGLISLQACSGSAIACTRFYQNQQPEHTLSKVEKTTTDYYSA